MNKIIFISLFLYILNARENPFINSQAKVNISTNIVKREESLEAEKIFFPKSARVLINVQLNYKNVDGSIGSKEVDINKYIDWHKAVVITQTDVEKTKKEKRKTVSSRIIFSYGAPKNFIWIAQKGKQIHITSENKMLRNFILTEPYRLVLDFKRDSNFLTYTKVIKSPPITKIILGNHENYYRIVIEFDTNYIIKEQEKQKNTYIFLIQ
jgi:hypothetical protein